MSKFASAPPRESFIDREIREAAEREEDWKRESLKDKARHGSLNVNTSSENQHKNSDNVAKENFNNFNDVRKECDEAPKTENVHSICTSRSVSVQVDSLCAPPLPSPPLPPSPSRIHESSPPPTLAPVEEPAIVPTVVKRKQHSAFLLSDDEDNKQVESLKQHVSMETTELIDHGADSGIECNTGDATMRSAMTIPMENKAPLDNTTKYQPQETSREELDGAKGTDSSPSPSVLSSASPKGWSSKTSHSSTTATKSGLDHSEGAKSDNILQEVAMQSVVEDVKNMKVLQQNGSPSPATYRKTTITVTPQKSGPSFSIMSSKCRLQTIMQEEIKEAQKREEEWKQKMLAQERSHESAHCEPNPPLEIPPPVTTSVLKNVRLTPVPVKGKPVKSPVPLPHLAPVTSPHVAPVLPPNIASVPLPQIDPVPPPQTYPVTPSHIAPAPSSHIAPAPSSHIAPAPSSHIDPVPPPHIKVDDVEYRSKVKLRNKPEVMLTEEDGEDGKGRVSRLTQRTVVEATRVQRRKSRLAMQWEAGQFRNNEE